MVNEDTDLGYVARGGFWLTLGQIATSLSAFLLSIAFANLLPKETYGLYRYVLSVASILAIPTLAGLNTALVQAVARGYEGSFVPALKTKLRWGVLGALASIAVGGWYWLAGNPTLTFAFLIAAPFIPLMESLVLYDSFLAGKQAFRRASTWRVLAHVGAVGTLVVTLFLTKNLLLVLLAYFASWTILRAFFLFLTVRRLPPTTAQDPETIRYGKQLSVLNVFNVLGGYADRLLIFHLLGPVEVAVYSFAIAPPEQIKSLLKSAETLALPRFAKESDATLASRVWKSVFLFGALLLGGTILYILLAPFLYRLVFPQYLEAVRFSQIFAISILALVLFLPTSALEAKRKTKELSFLTIVTAIIEVLALVVLITLFGLLGAIVARVLTRFFQLGTSLWFIHRSVSVAPGR